MGSPIHRLRHRQTWRLPSLGWIRVPLTNHDFILATGVSWPIFKKKQNPGDPLRIQNKTRQGESMAYLCIYIYGISCIFFSCIYIFHGNVYLIFHMFQAARFVVFKRLEAACTHRPVGGNGLAAAFHPRNAVASAGPRTENQETCCWVPWPRILGHGWMFLDSCWLLVMQFWRQ